MSEVKSNILHTDNNTFSRVFSRKVNTRMDPRRVNHDGRRAQLGDGSMPRFYAHDMAIERQMSQSFQRYFRHKEFSEARPNSVTAGRKRPVAFAIQLDKCHERPRAMTRSVCQMAWTGRARHYKLRERKATPCSTCHAERQPSVPKQRQKEETTSVPSSMKYERTLCKDTKFFDVTARDAPKKNIKNHGSFSFHGLYITRRERLKY